MIFHVRMDVQLPRDMSPEDSAALLAREKAYAQELQQKGTWRHLWRIVGEYANYSIFEVASAEELHTLLVGLPLFPYMKIAVTSLCRHPSSIRDDDR